MSPDEYEEVHYTEHAQPDVASIQPSPVEAR